jgi:hypothetical protein
MVSSPTYVTIPLSPELSQDLPSDPATRTEVLTTIGLQGTGGLSSRGGQPGLRSTARWRVYSADHSPGLCLRSDARSRRRLVIRRTVHRPSR